MKALCIFVVLIIAGCAGAHSHKNPSADFKNYKNVAVIRFDSKDIDAGIKTAGKIAVRLGERGFNIFEQNKLKKLLDEDVVVKSGLTEADKSALKASGINAIVFGALTRYECETKKAWIWKGFAPEQIGKNKCHASLSVKMIDIVSGETIWEADDSQSEYEVKMTEAKVLGIVLSRIEDVMPGIK